MCEEREGTAGNPIELASRFEVVKAIDDLRVGLEQLQMGLADPSRERGDDEPYVDHRRIMQAVTEAFLLLVLAFIDYARENGRAKSSSGPVGFGDNRRE
ncbi:MAG: hypothetical protein AAF604_00490 [Acidobacteriota bacterium]